MIRIPNPEKEERYPEPIDIVADFVFSLQPEPENERSVLVRPQVLLSDTALCAACLEASALVMQLATVLPKALGAMLLEFPSDAEQPPRLFVACEKKYFDQLMEIVKQVVLLLFETEGLPPCDHIQIVTNIEEEDGSVDPKTCERFALAIGATWFIQENNQMRFPRYSIWMRSEGRFHTLGD